MKQLLILSLAFALVFAASDFSSAAYQKQSRTAKLSQLWKAVIANTNSGSFPSALSLAGIFLESMSPSLDHVADSMPSGRSKLVHSVGTVVSAQFTPEGESGYTGFFTGADSLIIRFSLAKDPSYKNVAASTAYDNFAPGLAIKYLIDGQPSANIFSMPSVNGIHSYNYFSEDFNSHIPKATSVSLTLVATKFSQGTDVVQALGTRAVSQFTQNGNKVVNIKFPWKITFRATDAIKSRFTSDFTEEYTQTVSKIPAGTVLFDVFATDNPAENCLKKIGTITTTSNFTTSLFGDEGLFFQHPDFIKDLEVNPQWKPYTPFWNTFGNKDAQKPEGKCPFGF